MADLAADIATGGGQPPPGVPTQPGGSGLIHESVVAQPVGMIHENDLAQSIGSPFEPKMLSESEILQGQSAAPVQTFNPVNDLPKPEDIPSMNLMTAIPQAVAQSPAVKDFVSTMGEGGSLVARMTKPLAIPLQFETGVALRAGAIMGVPGMRELDQKLNPTRSWLPDAYVSDISDFYVDKATAALGTQAQVGENRAMLQTAKVGLGLAANVLLDPLSWTQIGSLSAEAQDIAKVGGKVAADGSIDRSVLDTAAARQKDLLSARNPITGTQYGAIRGQLIQDGLSKVFVDNPVAQSIGSLLKKFSPDTGISSLDLAGNTHDHMTRGDPVDLRNRYLAPKQALNMTSEENQVAMALGESTPNLRPNIPMDLQKAAEARPIAGGSAADGNPNMWADEGALRAQLSGQLQMQAKKLGVEIAPGRESAIVEGAMIAKKFTAEINEDRFNAGALTKENIAERVRENYVPHALNPSYQGLKSADE